MSEANAMRREELEDLSVSEIMTRWPATLRLFIDWHLMCVGCPIAPFHTLVDVAYEHGVICDELVEAVLEMVTRSEDVRAVPASGRRRSTRAHADRRP